MFKKIIWLIALFYFLIPIKIFGANDALLELVDYADCLLQYSSSSSTSSVQNPEYSHRFARNAILPLFLSDCMNLSRRQILKKYSKLISNVLKVVNKKELKQNNLTQLIRAIQLSIGSKQCEMLMKRLLQLVVEKHLLPVKGLKILLSIILKY